MCRRYWVLRAVRIGIAGLICIAPWRFCQAQAPVSGAQAVPDRPSGGQEGPGGELPVDARPVPNQAKWYDIRSRGAACDGKSDDTRALASAFASALNSMIELPAGACMINPGPASSTAAITAPEAQQFFTLEGRGPNFRTLFLDEGLNTSSAPMLKIGDGTKIMGGVSLSRFSIRSKPGVSYPRGMLYFDSINLTSVEHVDVALVGPSTDSIGMSNVPGEFSEMLFNDVHIFGGSASIERTGGNIGAYIRSRGGNTEFSDSSIESLQTALWFSGVDGTPVLNWRGGRMERIGSAKGGFSFRLEQTQPKIIGADIESGMIWLGDSVVNGTIDIGGSSAGWSAPYVDNGIGNSFHRVSGGAIRANAPDLKGDEWYRVAGNAVPDPTFMRGVGYWSASAAAVSVYDLKAPGAASGQSLMITPQQAGGYASQSFAVKPSTDYLVGGVFFFNKEYPSAQMQVYDQSNQLIWDSGPFGPSGGTPTVPDAWAYRFMKHWIPSGSATTFTIRIIAPASSPAIASALFLLPSSAQMSTAQTRGDASCSGTAASYSCSVDGNRAAHSSLEWNTQPPAYAGEAFLRFHASVAANAVAPEVTINSSSFSAPGNLHLFLEPGTSLDYTIPLGAFPSVVSFSDSGGAMDRDDIVVSQFSIHPIYAENVVPVADYADGQFVQAITPDGVQHRAAIGAGGLLYLDTTPRQLSGNGSAETIATTPPLGPMGPGQGIEVYLNAVREAGAGQLTWQLLLDSIPVYTCTYRSGVTSGSLLIRARIKNVAGSTTMQILDADPAIVGTDLVCGTPVSDPRAWVDWRTTHTISLAWTGASPTDKVKLEQMCVYSMR